MMRVLEKDFFDGFCWGLVGGPALLFILVFTVISTSMIVDSLCYWQGNRRMARVDAGREQRHAQEDAARGDNARFNELPDMATISTETVSTVSFVQSKWFITIDGVVLPSHRGGAYGVFRYPGWKTGRYDEKWVRRKNAEGWILEAACGEYWIFRKAE